MALINHAKREINAKIVYYGPEGGGKRSSLQYIYDRIKPSLRGDLKSPSDNGDSLFFFDFSPFEKPVFGNYHLRFHVYTIPGKVVNPAAWKMTLKGADGLVIVADSSPDLASIARESISELRRFLAAYGVGLHDVPCVLQLNKVSHSDNTPKVRLASDLDLPDIPLCFSESVSGDGVLEALSLLSREIMIHIGRDEALKIVDSGESQEITDDDEVSAALESLEVKSDQSGNESITTSEAESLSVASERNHEQLKVMVAGGGAIYNCGVMRIPLEFTLAGETRRMIISIAIEDSEHQVPIMA